MIQPRSIQVLAHVVGTRILAIGRGEVDVFECPSLARRFGTALNLDECIRAGGPRDIDEMHVIPGEGGGVRIGLVELRVGEAGQVKSEGQRVRGHGRIRVPTLM